MVESLTNGAWMVVYTLSFNRGDVAMLGTDMTPAPALRITSTHPIHVQMTGASSEFAWSAYSDAYVK